MEEREVQRVSRAATGGGRQPRVPGSRAESPGRALRDVQAKLNEYANQQAQQEAAANPVKQYAEHARSTSQAPTAAAPARKAQNDGYDDTSAEIADIDARLNALQSFLQNAGSRD